MASSNPAPASGTPAGVPDVSIVMPVLTSSN